jgi:5-methylcytosine-specific restriction endonuclease McrA
MQTLTPQHKKRISESLKGRTFSNTHRKNLRIANLGFKHSDASKLKMSLQRKGRTSPRKGCKLSPETLAKMSASLKGRIIPESVRLKISETHKRTNAVARLLGRPAWNKGLRGVTKHSQETKEKIRVSSTGRKNPNVLRGKDHYNWKGGITPKNHSIRNSLEYKLWRNAVFQRDNYTCVWCLKSGCELHADHIKPFALFPELRFSIDNGRTLCVPCHRTTDTYAGRSFNKKTVNSKDFS